MLTPSLGIASIRPKQLFLSNNLLRYHSTSYSVAYVSMDEPQNFDEIWRGRCQFAIEEDLRRIFRTINQIIAYQRGSHVLTALNLNVRKELSFCILPFPIETIPLVNKPIVLLSIRSLPSARK